MASPKIYYVRHGETDWNAEMRYQGQQDIPLNDLGRSQAAHNGEKLSKVLGKAAGFQFSAANPHSKVTRLMSSKAEPKLSSETQFVDGVRDIVENYDTFLLDMWYVIDTVSRPVHFFNDKFSQLTSNQTAKGVLCMTGSMPMTGSWMW